MMNRSDGPGSCNVEPLSLKARFERFMATSDFAESIDEIAAANQPGRQKADYLASARSVIIEQKSFDRDVDAKVRTLLGKLAQQHGPFGRKALTLADMIGVIGTLPPGNPFKPRLLAILTQKIDDVLAKADKQTHDTRHTLSLPTAIGVVVILNEHAPLIEPDYFVVKAWQMLRKELAPGVLRYPDNQVVILISEAHRQPSEEGDMRPVETVFSEAGLTNPAAESFAVEFRRRWADFNDAGTMEWPHPVREVTTTDPAKLFEID